MDFETIKYYLKKKFWTKKMVKVAKIKGVITQEEYEELIKFYEELINAKETTK